MDPPGSDNDLGAFPSDGDGHVGARRGPPAATATTPPPPRPPRRRRRPPERSRKRAVAGGCPERAVPHGAKRQRGGTAEPPDSLDPPSADGDRLFAQKCRELQGFIRPLAELLQGLRAGRYEKGLSTFQQSVAMDRIQRIIGVLQKPEMGGRYLGTLLQVEMMLKLWFPHVAPKTARFGVAHPHPPPGCTPPPPPLPAAATPDPPAAPRHRHAADSRTGTPPPPDP